MRMFTDNPPQLLDWPAIQAMLNRCYVDPPPVAHIVPARTQLTERITSALDKQLRDFARLPGATAHIFLSRFQQYFDHEENNLHNDILFEIVNDWLSANLKKWDVPRVYNDSKRHDNKKLVNANKDLLTELKAKHWDLAKAVRAFIEIKRLDPKREESIRQACRTYLNL